MMPDDWGDSKKLPLLPASSCVMLRPSGDMPSYRLSIWSTPAPRPEIVCSGPALRALTPDAARAEIVGQVFNGRVECRFADAHDVVARHCFFATEVGERENARAVVEDILRGVGQGDQAKRTDFHRQLKTVAAGGYRVAFEIGRQGKGDRVQQEVDLAHLVAAAIHHRADVFVIGDIHRLQEFD